MLVRSEIFFDRDYKEVEFNAKSDKKWAFVQDRIHVERDKIVAFAAEYREETGRICQQLQNFEKMFEIVANLLITQMNNPLTTLPHQHGKVPISARDDNSRDVDVKLPIKPALKVNTVGLLALSTAKKVLFNSNSNSIYCEN